MSALTDGLLDEVAALLAGRVGLEPATLGRDAVAAAVRSRLAGRGPRAAAHYLERLRGDDAEFRDLVEELVVLESWFFRDGRPFECLRWFVGEHRPGRPLRLLSVPCGTGEEPYSMALTLLAAGLEPDAFEVDAVDLSRRALARALRGAYGARSFREPVDWAVSPCQRYLRPEGEEFRVADGPRDRVRFQEGNLADPGFLGGRRAAYDVIFCRNLLIYFTEEARRAALTNLHRLLAEGGLLYLGHTEGRAGLDPRFAPLTAEYPFAFTPAPQRPASPAGRTAVVAPQKRGKQGRRPSRPAPAPVSEAPPAAVPSLGEARAAANAGRLDEAARVCEALARQRPPPADALSLLGVVRQAQGRADDAERCFQQALYLDPGCHEALVHLTLLAEARGDREQAARYRRRAGRSGTGREP